MAILVLDVAEFFADFFDDECLEIWESVDDEVVGGGVAVLGTAETALELRYAVEAVGSLICANDTPEVVAGDASLSGVAHGLHME